MGNMLEIVANPNQTLLINDHSLKADANGLIRVNVGEVIIHAALGLAQFDYILESESILTKTQRISLYELFAEWSQFGKVDIVRNLSIDKSCADKVVSLAGINKVLVKSGNQWKAKKEVKEQLRAFMNKLSHTEKMETHFEEEISLSGGSIKIKDEGALSEEDIPKRKVVVKKEKPMNIPRRKS